MPEQPASELELLANAELVRLSRKESESALRLIVRRYNQRLYRVAWAIVRDDADAEDVMQEAYLSAFRNLAKFRADASLATWLTRIVVNKAVDCRQRASAMPPRDTLDKIERPDAAIMSDLASELDPDRTAAWSQVASGKARRVVLLERSLRLHFVSKADELTLSAIPKCAIRRIYQSGTSVV
ncbi:sigma-70 family RNA polymerase sigma factor, partial [Microvirga sp. G4-2]|uniref:sigma-70 family RNA polymerase sigma factor n=1 Tax=Microvirga sp. G4-2 TaxID=3434467 RepID=UPI0040445E9B